MKVRENEVLTAITTKTIFTRGETVSTTLAAAASTDVRDAFVKGIYGRMFIGIVSRINAAIYRPNSKGAQRRMNIGVLDIFGFEDFDKNRQVTCELTSLWTYFCCQLLWDLSLSLSVTDFVNLAKVTAGRRDQFCNPQMISSGGPFGGGGPFDHQRKSFEDFAILQWFPLVVPLVAVVPLTTKGNHLRTAKLGFFTGWMPLLVDLQAQRTENLYY